MGEELVINFTPTGMIPTKQLTPYASLSVNEIVDDVLKACEIGITMVHLHAREPVNDEPTYKKEIYAAIIEKIRKYQPELVICVSLSGRNFKELEKRANPLFLEGNLKPDMGSLTLSSLNFNQTASVNSPEIVQSLARIMREKGIVPELEVFDLGMINYAKYLKKKKLLTEPFYFNILLGNIATAQSNLLHAAVMINDLPENCLWSLAGIGTTQLNMNAIALSTGGGVRIGLEDNIWFDENKTKLATNIELIKRIKAIATLMGRKTMSAANFRKRMSLLPGKGAYGRLVQEIVS